MKDPDHSAKHAGGRLRLNTKSERADYAADQALCVNLSRNELAHNLSGNIHTQLSQLAEPLWTDPGMKTESGISVHELIFTLKKKARVGNEWSNILLKSLQARLNSPPHMHIYILTEALG